MYGFDELEPKRKDNVENTLLRYQDRDAIENAAMSSKKRYTRQEVIDFYKQVHEMDSDGCYNVHVPTWSAMQRQHPRLCVELQIEDINKKIKHKPKKPLRSENEYCCDMDSNTLKLSMLKLFALSFFWFIVGGIIGICLYKDLFGG